MGSADRAERSRLELVTEAARDALTVRRVFGDPVVHGDVTVIPVARVRGGHGIGSWSAALGSRGGGEGIGAEVGPPRRGGRGHVGGGGFGVDVRPAGVFVLRGDDAEWRPTLDVTRIALGGQAVAVVAILAATHLARRSLARRAPVVVAAAPTRAPLLLRAIPSGPRLVRRAAVGTTHLLAAALRRR
jgi:uncharacterized spore protein YtfJ